LRQADTGSREAILEECLLKHAVSMRIRGPANENELVLDLSPGLEGTVTGNPRTLHPAHPVRSGDVFFMLAHLFTKTAETVGFQTIATQD
jgi:hypothetical protein